MTGKSLCLTTLGFFVLSSCTPLLAEEETPRVQDWSWSGDNGPENWASVSPTYRTCGSGMNQSPVDLGRSIPADLPELEFGYGKPLLVVRHDENGMHIEGPAGNTITINGHSYALRDIAFHEPAQHSVNGRHAPMELDFRHTDKHQRTVMVAVMVESGEHSRALARIWDNVPGVNRSMSLTGELLPSELLPEQRHSWQYNGSLATPPCSEGVQWWVMKTPIHASREQLEQYRDWFGNDSARPVQPLNARYVLQ